MGGGDNELIIKSVLDATGFEKGSKKLMSAINGLSRSLKRAFGSIIGVASVFGLISRAVSTFMSQNQELTKQMNAAWTALGNALGPIITQIINWVTQAVSYLVTFMKLLGFTAKTASDASKAAKGAAGSLQRTVAGFDELNKLQDGGGSGAGTLKDVDPQEWMDKLAEALKQKAWDAAADIIVGKFNELIAKAKEKSEELGVKIGEYLQGAFRIGARIIKDVDWSGIGATIANFFNGILQQVDGKDLGTILVGKFVIAIGMVTGFFENIKLDKVAQFLSDAIIGAFNAVGDAIEKADWKKIGENIRSFFANINWSGIATAIFDALRSAWNAALDLLWGLMSEDTENEPPLIGALRDIGDAVFKFVTTVTELVTTLWDALKPAWDWVWNNILSPVISGIINDATSILSSLTTAIEGLIKLIKGETTFGEFAGSLDGVAIAVAVLGLAFGGAKLATWLGGLKTPAFIASQGISNLGELFLTLAAIIGPGGALFVALTTAIGAFVILDEVVTINKIGYADAGLSAEEYAQNVADMAEQAEKAQKEFDELAQYSSELTMEQNKLDHANIALNNSMIQLAQSLGISVDELKAQIEAAGGDVTQIEALKHAHDQLIESNEGVAESAREATDAVAASTQGFDNSANAADNTADRYQEAARRLIENYENVATSNQENMSAVEGYTSQHIGEATDIAVSETDEMQRSTSDSFNDMRAEAEANMMEIREVITNCWNDIINNTSEAVGTVRQVVSNGFATLVSEAGVWGWDLIVNFRNGMVRAVNSVLIPTMENIAQAIRNYIGFSEPKLGPLSDFHTYGPDMMELYAKGIKSSSGEVVSAVSSVAEDVANEFGGTTASVSAVASGSVVPYGVSGGVGGGSGSSADLSGVMEEFRSLVQDFRYSVENMEFIAQFGDLKAVAKQITTIQKQMERAGG